MGSLITANVLLRKKIIMSKFIRNATHVYQPIYDIKQSKIIGCEALMRNITSKTLSPLLIFDKAKEYGLHNELDLYLLHAAQRNILNETGTLFLNIFPSTLLIENFIKAWDETVQFKDIVLELNQIEEIEEWDMFKEVLADLKRRGIKFAIDGVGDKFSNLKRLVELQPDYIKTHTYFGKNLSQEKIKQNLIRYLLQALDEKTKLIVEGIEEKKDFYVAKELGVTYAQGYYLGRPMLYEKLYRQATKNKRRFYINYEALINQLENKEEKTQEVEIIRNYYSDKYYDISFETPLCAKMALIEINGKSISSGKTNVCISKISPKGLQFLSVFKFPSSTSIVLHFQTILNGHSLDIKGKITNSCEIQTGVYRYTIQLIADEVEVSRNVRIFNDFQIFLRKGKLIENTSFCSKADDDRCVHFSDEYDYSHRGHKYS